MHFDGIDADVIGIALVQGQNSIADPIDGRDRGDDDADDAAGGEDGDGDGFDRATIDAAAILVAIAANLDCSFRLATVPRWLCKWKKLN